MKLLMITGLGSIRDLVSDRRGAFYNTLEEFSKYWDRIDIISPRVRGFDTGVKVIFGNVFMHISPWPLILHPFWFLKKGVEIYREQKFDLMTVHEFPPFYNGVGARLLWRKIKVPYVLEIHHIPGYPKAADFKEKLYRSAMRRFIKYDAAKARAVRVVNQHQVPEFLIKAGVPMEKIIYIPSFYIDLEIFRPINLPKEYDLIFVGRLAKNKGVGLLLKAMANIKIQMPNIRLLFVGDGPELNRLKLQTKNYKLETNVTFWGWAKDSQEVAELINKSRILIMPSYNEGGPRVVLEAMACGVPVLATPVGIVPDTLEEDMIIDWESVDIAQRALKLLENKAEYQQYSQVGSVIAVQFEKRKAIENYARKLLGYVVKNSN